MSAETHTVDTIYGEAEIEVVECSSCGTEVAKAEAEPFAIGDGPDAREGWACEHCAAEGPADFPNDEWIPDRIFIPLVLGLYPVYCALGVNDYLDGNLSDNGRWFLLGGLGALFWIGIIAGLLTLTSGSSAPEGAVPL